MQDNLSLPELPDDLFELYTRLGLDAIFQIMGTKLKASSDRPKEATVRGVFRVIGKADDASLYIVCLLCFEDLGSSRTEISIPVLKQHFITQHLLYSLRLIQELELVQGPFQ